MLPNCVILGAQKAGSTFLHRCLGEHPDVFTPTGEVHFFEDPNYSERELPRLETLLEGGTESGSLPSNVPTTSRGANALAGSLGTVLARNSSPSSETPSSGPSPPTSITSITASFRRGTRNGGSRPSSRESTASRIPRRLLDLYREAYDFDAYRGRRSLAGYSRWAEFHGQLQRCLKKVDMASMRHSLEVRVPLLDREVIETSLRIDPFESMRNGTRKAVLRDSLARYVPPEMIPKGKKGFAVPLTEWLRGPLRPLAEDTLFSGPLFPEGIFDRRAVRRYWEDHLSGLRDVKWGIWTLMALQWWARAHRVPAASRDV